MKKSDRIRHAAKVEATIAAVLSFAVIGCGAQIEPLAAQEAIFRAFACLALVFVFMACAVASASNAFRLWRQARAFDA